MSSNCDGADQCARLGLRSVNEAIRRRLLLAPFNIVIPVKERDKDPFGAR
jgi:hypothetical protein